MQGNTSWVGVHLYLNYFPSQVTEILSCSAYKTKETYMLIYSERPEVASRSGETWFGNSTIWGLDFSSLSSLPHMGWPNSNPGSSKGPKGLQLLPSLLRKFAPKLSLLLCLHPTRKTAYLCSGIHTKCCVILTDWISLWSAYPHGWFGWFSLGLGLRSITGPRMESGSLESPSRNQGHQKDILLSMWVPAELGRLLIISSSAFCSWDMRTKAI